ncbi:MAG: hypothetical protein GC179_10960 [Anaerolineaceae bacterium]|nr:hypothetical protein [Anaerolineaceae bacterium]
MSRLNFSTQPSVLSTFFLLLLLAACQPVTPTPAPLPQSAWGSVITVAQAEQTDAPALYVDEKGITTAWVGADEQGVFQALRTLNTEGMSDVVRLPLPVRPYAQQFAPASNHRLHLFWLDSNVNGETRLFTALLKPNLDRDRELTILTQQVTRRYTLLPTVDGGVWAIASGGLSSEPNLYAHFVDDDGRWRLSDNYLIAENADWPAVLQRPDGLFNLYWLRSTDGAVMQSGFIEGQAIDPHPLTDGVILNPGDRLDSFSAAQDSSQTYLFWNVSRADGRHETWLAADTFDQSAWPPPTRLRISVPNNVSTNAPAVHFFESGFNSGVAYTASEGRDNVSWVKPASGLFSTLPVAAQVDNQIAIVFLRGGHIVGYRPMDTGTKINLIGTPNLVVDRDLYLYLAWSQPDLAGYANLQLASLKFGSWAWLKNPTGD